MFCIRCKGYRVVVIVLDSAQFFLEGYSSHFVMRLSGVENKFVYSLKLAADMIKSGVEEFVYYMGVPAFLKRNLVGLYT